MFAATRRVGARPDSTSRSRSPTWRGNANVSPRTFSRRFVEDTGYTPMQWVLRARVDLARELLERTDLGVEQIADRVGLGTGANLRLHFHRILGTSPSEYRHTFAEPAV